MLRFVFLGSIFTDNVVVAMICISIGLARYYLQRHQSAGLFLLKLRLQALFLFSVLLLI